MKKFAFLFIAYVLFAAGCGNTNDNKSSNNSESTSPSGPAPDNSNATNPSLKDTLFTDTTRH